MDPNHKHDSAANRHFAVKCNHTIGVTQAGGTSWMTENSEFSICNHKPVSLVPVVGVEPTRCCHHKILSLARLPIPSHRQKGPIHTNGGHSVWIQQEAHKCEWVNGVLRGFVVIDLQGVKGEWSFDHDINEYMKGYCGNPLSRKQTHLHTSGYII